MRVGRSCTQNRRHEARRGLERVRSEPYPRTGPSSGVGDIEADVELPGHLRPPSRIFRAAWRQFSIYTVNSQRVVNINAKLASQTVNLGRFITYHHIGNLLAILCIIGCKDGTWWIGFGVSPWFSATTRRLFGRVCEEGPSAELAIPHSRAHPLLDEAPRATPPRSTARPNPGLHLTRNHPGGTRPRQFPRGEAQLRKKDVRVEATNGPPRGRLRDGPARVHRGSRAIHRAPTRPRLRRGHRADWKGAFHPATSTHRAPRPASSSEPIHEVNLVHSASFRKPSLTPDIPTCPVP